MGALGQFSGWVLENFTGEVHKLTPLRMPKIFGQQSETRSLRVFLEESFNKIGCAISSSGIWEKSA